MTSFDLSSAWYLLHEAATDVLRHDGLSTIKIHLMSSAAHPPARLGTDARTVLQIITVSLKVHSAFLVSIFYLFQVAPHAPKSRPEVNLCQLEQFVTRSRTHFGHHLASHVSHFA